MLTSLFPLIYCFAAIVLLWQAFRVMRRPFLTEEKFASEGPTRNNSIGDRTGRLTIHPELLDEDGRITDEELLTVRFSEDLDSSQSAETSSE